LTFAPITEDFAGGGTFSATVPIGMTGFTVRVTATDPVSGKSASEVFSILPTQQRWSKPDGSYDIYHTDLTGLPYQSYEDIYDSGKTEVAEARDYASQGNLFLDRNSLLIVFAAGADSVRTGPDTFAIDPHPAEMIAATDMTNETFKFSAYFGGDAFLGFDSSGRSHDVAQLELSMFDYLKAGMTQAQDAAAVISHATQSGSDTIIRDTRGDVLTFDGVSKAILAANLADFRFA
jgi:hypothetical protein